MTYKLSRKADEDVLNLYVNGVRDFGVTLVEEYFTGPEQTFSRLAKFPRMARERTEITPPVRIHPYRSHMIIYVFENEEVLILRVRHGREDRESQPLG